MTQRLNWIGKAPEGIEAMQKVETYLAHSSLSSKLKHLVKMRASQINGCAYCLHMHSEDARAEGESDARLHLLNAWEESALFDEKERAALAWTDALTKVTEGHAPDEVYAEVRAQFDDRELVDLSIAIAMINAWNRLSIGFRAAHPSDRPKG